MSRTPWRIALSGAALTTLLAAAPAVAAEDSSTNQLLQELVSSSSQAPGSTGSAIDATLSSMDALGSSELSFEGPLLSSEADYPLETDPSISEVELLDVEADDRAERLERWHVCLLYTSPSPRD